MWVAELRLWHAGSEILDVTERFDVTAHSVYLNAYEKRGRQFVSKVLAFHGKDAKAAMAELVCTMRRYAIHRVEGNCVFFTIPAGALSYHTAFLDENVFFIKPFFLKEGREYWTVGAFDKKDIRALVRKIRKDGRSSNVELLSLKKQRPDLFVPDALAGLGPKQNEVLLAALDAGYYGYPRKTTLKALGHRLGLSPATVREHLRKAEARILPAAVQPMARR